jgi:class 3 adenylate cyclase
MSATASVDADHNLTALSPELRRNGPIGRFPDPTETAYQEWAIQQAMPSVRILTLISIVGYGTNPYFSEQIFGWGYPIRVLVFNYAVAVPLAVICLVVINRRPNLFWYGAAIILVIALCAIPVFTGSGIARPGTTLLTLAFLFVFVVPVLQYPFRQAALLVALMTPAYVASALMSSSSTEHDGTLTYLIYILVLVSLMTVTLRFVGERNSRDRFAAEQELARQRELLTASRALIRRYAPPAVADRLEVGDTTVDTAQRRRVTVFFADIVGFTVLADRLDPEALAEIVNEYLGAVAHIIEVHGGTLNEFAGDGVMAIFGAPNEMESMAQVTAALAAAQELQRSLPEWSRRWYRLGIDQDLQARIGINTGVISVGTFGSAVRATYTGIGLQTNIAARIQAQCSPGSVLLSKTSWHLLDDTVACEPRGEVEVKGVHFPVAMYELTNH